MAIYKLFPYKDTTLYSFYPKMNTGIDPINQISNLNFSYASNSELKKTIFPSTFTRSRNHLTNFPKMEIYKKWKFTKLQNYKKWKFTKKEK